MLSQTVEAYLAGMQRSGQHAIINWLVDGFTSIGVTPVFCNWINQHQRTTFDKHANHAPVYFYGIEDPTATKMRSWDRQRRVTLPAYDVRLGLLVLRDPYNLLASRMTFDRRARVRQGSNKPVVLMCTDSFEAVELWKDNARLVSKHADQVVLYNRWHVEPAYRASVMVEFASKVGVPADRLDELAAFAKKPRNELCDAGLGSSFTDTTVTDASQMPLLSRWEALRGNPLYCSLIDDEELRQLSLDLFGFAVVSNHGELTRITA